ncbi:MAG: hypothetical protein U0768_12935 [Anaerolineae bacterium]
MRLKTILCLVIFGLVLIAACAGLFYQTPGAPIPYVTVRGEQATFYGAGLYRYDPVSVAREGKVWDAINLILALPMFAVAIYLDWRRSLRGRLLLSGLLFYFAYQYLQYAAMLAFNPLFLVYVTIFALSAVAFFINLADIDVARLPSQISAKFPRRLFIAFTFVMGAALILLWLGRIIPFTLAGRFPDELAGMTTLVTQALDLGMVVPLMLATGILLWWRSAWGYFLAAVSLTFGFIMSVTLPAWIIVPLVQDGVVNLVEASPLLVLCAIGLYVAVQFFRSIQPGETPARASALQSCSADR